ncbi:MAG: hypothetical protein IJ301_02200 [Clostridia bacterium]|nr:hypothetical protein [Clostridia bacterium]
MLGAYPVGSIYLSVNNISPASLFGGSWEKIKDKFLLSSGDTYSLGATGGEATHTLTVDEMPDHSHGITATKSVTNSEGGRYPLLKPFYPAGDWERIDTDGTQGRGGGQAHNNMPPYLVVNVWKRIS